MTLYLLSSGDCKRPRCVGSKVPNYCTRWKGDRSRSSQGRYRESPRGTPLAIPFCRPRLLINHDHPFVRCFVRIRNVVNFLHTYQDLPAPNEHAFILRRYDTGAISVTTMFKAAFPGATEEEEEREMRWVSHPLGLLCPLHLGRCLKLCEHGDADTTS